MTARSVGGLRVRRDGVSTQLSLDRVRGSFEHEGETYLLFDELGERPWLRLDAERLGAAQVEELLRTVEAARGRGGYRDVAHVQAAPRDAVDALSREVAAGRAVPGAHVVRGAFGPPTKGPGLLRIAQAAAFLLGVGGALLVGLGLFSFSSGAHPHLSDPSFVVALLLAGGLGCALGLTLGVVVYVRWPRRPAPRRLLIAPAGVVVPVAGGACAFAWSDLAPLRVAPSHFGSAVPNPGLLAPRGFATEDALQVRRSDGSFLAEVVRSASAEPLELVAALSAHYQRAATS